MRSGGLGRTVLKQAWAFGLCGVLTGCAYLTSKPPVSDGNVAETTIHPSTDDLSEVKTATTLENEAVEAGEHKALMPRFTPPVPPQMKPEIAAMQAEALIGMAPEDVFRRLGVPTQIRDESPVLIWHYENEPCILTIQFFKELQTDVFRALQYDIAGGSEAACLSRLERAREGV